MKIFALLSLFVVCCASVSAQKSPAKFGDISMDDMTMKSYAADTSAAAVYLLDYEEAHIEERVDAYKLVTKVHVRIKVLKPEGKDLADISILLRDLSSTRSEKVNSLKAATYNLEGGKIVATPISKENVFRQQYDKTRVIQKFTMPSVKPGSIIEYTYIIDSDFFAVFPNWRFQRKNPIRHAEFWTITPSAFVFEKYMKGYLTPVYERKEANLYGFECVTHHWTMDNVPAFQPEPQMTGEADYISQVNFALSGITVSGIYKDFSGSWEKIAKEFSESEAFGLAITKNAFLKSKADELTPGMTDAIQKIQALHTFVKRNIEWNGIEDYEAYPLKKILDEKKGSSGDINLLLASLLNKAGLDVDMILLSTRDHGFIRQEYPMERQFNYVICSVMVGDKIIMLDATEPNLPYTVLPERCLNGQGLYVSAKRTGWVDVTTKAKAKTIISADFAMNPTGEMKGKVAFSRDGYSAYEMREDFISKGQDAYVKSVADGRSWKLEKSEFADVTELEKPVKETHELTIEEHASVTDGVIYINPFIDSRLEENPFKLETRVYPVDFGRAEEVIYICKIAIPEGYTVDELPKSKAMALPGNAARFTYNASQLNNTINITSSIQINKVLYVQNEYPALREFYAQVIAKQDEQIVLKKK